MKKNRMVGIISCVLSVCIIVSSASSVLASESMGVRTDGNSESIYSTEEEVANTDSADLPEKVSEKTYLFESGSLSMNSIICPDSEDGILPAVGAGNVSKIRNPRTNSMGISTWDCIWFGRYWQNKDSNGDGKVTQADEKEPIKWRVLEIDNYGNALLIADTILEVKPFSKYRTGIPYDSTWEVCTLRSYLNSYGDSFNNYREDYSESGFMNNAFSVAEIGAISITELENDDVPHYGTEGGNKTNDKVFCLSVKEALNPKYGFISNTFTRGIDNSTMTENDDGRKANITKYVYDIPYSWNNGIYWLRTLGENQRHSSGIGYSFGDVIVGSFHHTWNEQVRPALKINLSDHTNLWSNAGTVSADGSDDDIRDEISFDSEEIETDVTMLPGETKRLSLTTTGQYIYGVKWEVISTSPKGCVSVKNGVVAAKKSGTAKVKATYRDSNATFDIFINGRAPEVVIGGKGNKITATKTLSLDVGTRKNATINLPKGLQGQKVSYEISTPGICTLGNAGANKNGSKIYFKVDPQKAGATYIIWTVNGDTPNKTQAYTKVIVKEPIDELRIRDKETDSPLKLAVGGARKLTVTGTKGNTDPKELSFSVSGKGVKVSKSGLVIGTMPGGSGTVTVKSGKCSDSIRVEVSGDTNKYIALNKTVLNVSRPKNGSKSTKVGIAIPKKPVLQPSLNWKVLDSPSGISITRGIVSIAGTASPGCYILKATPSNISGGYNTAYCELIVR